MLGLIRYIIINLLGLLNILLLVYCVCSWVIRDPYNKFYRVICSICDPILNPLRAVLQRIPFMRGLPIDLSPYLLMVLLRALTRFI